MLVKILRKLTEVFVVACTICISPAFADYDDIIDYPPLGEDIDVLLFQAFGQLADGLGTDDFMHEGVDLSSYDTFNGTGTPIYAVRDGEIEEIQAGGMYIVWLYPTDPDDKFYAYGHCRKLSSLPDFTFVNAGDEIGYINPDEYGSQNGHHLHFEIRNNAQTYRYNPLNWDSFSSGANLINIYGNKIDTTDPLRFDPNEDEIEWYGDPGYEGLKYRVSDIIYNSDITNLPVYCCRIFDMDDYQMNYTKLDYMWFYDSEDWENFTEFGTRDHFRVITSDSEPNFNVYSGLDYSTIINNDNHETYGYIKGGAWHTRFEFWDADSNLYPTVFEDPWIGPWTAAIPFDASVESYPSKGEIKLAIEENEYFGYGTEFFLYRGDVESGYLLNEEPVPLITDKNVYIIGVSSDAFMDETYYSLLIGVPSDGNYVFNIKRERCECIDWYR